MSRLTAITDTKAGSPVASFSFTLDAAGNRTSAVKLESTQPLTYGTESYG